MTMRRKLTLVALSVALLFAGAGLAQTDGSGDGMSEAEAECHAEYQEAIQKADEEYADSYAEAESQEERDEANATYEEEKAEAAADREECLTDAREEAAEQEAEAAEEEAEREEEEEEDESDEEELPVPDNVSGEHVSFDVTAGGIADYSVNGTSLFADVSGSAAAEWEEYAIDGSMHKLEGEAELKVFDTSTGWFIFEDDGDVTLELADGLRINDTAHERDGKVRLVIEGPDDLTAHLYVEEGYSVDNGTIVSEEEVRFSLVDGEGVLFRHQEHREETAEAIADGRIAAQVDVPRGGPPQDAEFGDVDVQVEETEDGLVATVESHGDGKTFLFNIEEGIFEDLQSLDVIFDGEPIGLADDLDDVLDVSDGVAEYLIIYGADGAQVFVQVPHFSVHTIALQSSASESAEAPSLGAVVVGAGALAAAAVARRRA